MRKRNQALVVVFTILTCGIYKYYWMYVVTRDVESVSDPSGGPCSSPAAAVLLSIFTCGIYDLYWYYELGGRTGRILSKSGSESGLGYMLLALFGLSIVSQVLLQTDVNAVVDKCMRVEPLPVEPVSRYQTAADGTAPSDRPQKERPADSEPNQDGFEY